jgi:hypothetical protein
MITWALIAPAVTALVLVVLVQGKWLVRSRLHLGHDGHGDRPLRQSDQLAFRQSSSAVATSPEGHRSRRSGREGQHRRWGREQRQHPHRTP